MAYIKKKSERKFKITVCNGYKVNGQKRMKAQTITVPSSVPKRGIQQYVMAEAERIEKKFKYGVEESDQTHFEQYAENWLKRQEPFFKATTYSTEKPGRLILKINALPADKKATFSTEEIRLMRITINRLRNERLGKGQYTDAADDMLLKLF